MTWLLARVAEPWETGLVVRGMLAIIAVGVTTGAIGVFVVLRGLAFTGEAFAHAVFPGAVLAAMLGASIPAGALAFGLVAAGGVALAARERRLGEDSAVGVVFVGAFAAGVLLLATTDRVTRNLESFLFGSLLGVSPTDLAVTGGVGLLVLTCLAAMWRPLVATTFDPDVAAADGVRPGLVAAGLLGLLVVAIVVALQAVGTVLVLAMLVTPAVTARLLTGRMVPTVLLAAALGAAEGVVGLYVSYYGGVAAGGAVVLVSVAALVIALVASPRGGLTGRILRRRATPAPA